MEPKEYEFTYMTVREKLKLLMLKVVSLMMVGLTIACMVHFDEKLSTRLSSAGACMAAVWLYTNLYRVKSEVMELFEPPYPLAGNGLGIIALICFIVGTYSQLQGN